MKRVWAAARAVSSPNGWGVQLDGKPLRLPGGAVMLVPQAALAQAVADEWQSAGSETGEMDYSDVPLTRLAGTAQLRIVPDPAPSAAAIAAYGEADLLCYRADTPPELVRRQDESWSPWLDWARQELGAALTVTSGVMYVPQHPAALTALRRAVSAESGWVLAGLGLVVPALGSLVLGLALAHGALTADEADALSHVDETFQAELWGADEQAEQRRAAIRADIETAAHYIELVR